MPIDPFGREYKVATDNSVKAISDSDPMAKYIFDTDAPKSVNGAGRGRYNFNTDRPVDPLRDSIALGKVRDEESGFFNNVSRYLSIGQQVGFSAAKNLGEYLRDKELTDKSFMDDLSNALEGNSSMSFHRVMESFGVDWADPTLPTEVTDLFQNPYLKIGASVATGIAAGLLAPVVGAAAAGTVGVYVGFSTFGALSGQGVTSSVANVMLDPLNKLTLLQKANKGLVNASKGVTKESVLSQLASGERNLFNFQTELGLGKPVDVAFSNIMKPANLVGENAGRILNVPILKQGVQHIINPITGSLDTHVLARLRSVFTKNGDIDLAKFDDMDTADIFNKAVNLSNDKSPEVKDILDLLETGTFRSEAEKFRFGLTKLEELTAVKKSPEVRNIETQLQKVYHNKEALEGIGESALAKQGDKQFSPTTRDVPIDDLSNVKWEDMKAHTKHSKGGEFQLRVEPTPRDVSIDDLRNVKWEDMKTHTNYSKGGELQLQVEPTELKKEFIPFLEGSSAEISRLKILREQAFKNRDKEQIASLDLDISREYADIDKASNALLNSEGVGMGLAEKTLFSKLISSLFGKEGVEDMVRVFKSDAGAGLKQGTSDTNRIAVQILSEGGLEGAGRLSLKMYRSADIEDAIGALGGHVYDNLKKANSPELNKLVQGVYDPRAYFTENFFAAGLYGINKDKGANSGVLGTIIDSARSSLRYISKSMDREAFVNKDVGAELHKFLNDLDYFDVVRSKKISSHETLLKVSNLKDSENIGGNLAKMAIRMQEEMQASGLLPKFLGLKPSVNGFVRIPTLAHADVFEDIRKANLDYGLYISAGEVSRAGHHTSNEYLNLISSIVNPKNRAYIEEVLTKKEINIIQGIGKFNGKKFVYNADVDAIAKPGTPAYDAIKKVRDTFEIIPYNAFENNLSVLMTHMSRDAGSGYKEIATRAIEGVAVSPEDLSVRFYNSIANNIGVVRADPNKVEALAQAIRKVTPLLKGANPVTKEYQMTTILEKLQKGFVPSKGDVKLAKLLPQKAGEELTRGYTKSYKNFRSLLNTEMDRLTMFGKGAERARGLKGKKDLSAKDNEFLAGLGASSVDEAIKSTSKAANFINRGVSWNKLKDLRKRLKDEDFDSFELSGGDAINLARYGISKDSKRFIVDLERAVEVLTRETPDTNKIFKLLAQQDLTRVQLKTLETELQKLIHHLPYKDVNDIFGHFTALKNDGVEAISKNLDDYHQATNRLFDADNLPKDLDVDTILNPGAVAGKLSKLRADGPNIFKSIINDIKSKRKGDPQIFNSVQQAPITPEYLKGLDEAAVSADALEEYVARGWVPFAPKGQVSPLLSNLVGKYVPKELHRYLVGDEVKLGRAFEGLGQVLTRLVRGFTDEESLAHVHSASDALERGLFGGKFKVGEGVRNSGARILSNANFDYLTNLFKSQALLSVGYHGRNGISGVVVNLMHGVDAKHHSRALQQMWEVNRGRAGKYSQEWDEFVKSGGTGQGTAGEVAKDVRGLSRLSPSRPETSINPLSTSFAGYKINFQVGGYVEDFVRFASYLKSRGAKKSVLESMEDVKKLHFDYNDLSSFEQSTMKRIIPFYTYFRKAVVRDSRMFMDRTGNVFKKSHFLEQIERGVENPEDPSVVAEYVRDHIGVPFTRDKDTGEVSYLLLDQVIPSTDLWRRIHSATSGKGLMGSIFSLVGAQLQDINPIPKILLENAVNKNFYFGNKLEKYDGELTDMLGVAVNRRGVVRFLQTIRVLKDLDRVYKTQFNRVDAPQEIRPDTSNTLLNLGLGVNVKTNKDPYKNFKRNVEYPVKDALRSLKAAHRKGGVNIPVAQQNLIETIKKARTSAHKARGDIFRGKKTQEPSALQRLFNRPNKDNL